MKSHRQLQRLRASVIAVHCALGIIGSVHAADVDPALLDLVEPKREVEIGVVTASGYTAKANEFTGWSNRGPNVFGNIDLRGGGKYDSNDATRWQIVGTRLGSKSPSLDLEYGVQGSYRIKLGFDDLLRNQSDSYQTPYKGVGTNTSTLPSNWLAVVVPRVNATTPNARGLSPAVTSSNAIVGGVSTPPTAAQLAAAGTLQSADLPAFSHVDLFTKRSHYGLNWDQQIGLHWALNAGFSLENKTGLKALGAQSRATNGDTSSILPTPINQDDNKFHLGANYTGDALQMQATYEDSTFTNNIPYVSWNLWGAPQITATAATAPSNRFRKMLLSASYKATESTTVTGAASYSRATQNAAFLNDTTALLVPVSSANALVVNESMSLKVAHKATARLNLSAGYKYDLRDNRTQVNIFGYYDNNNAPTGTSPFQYLYPNLPGLGQNFNFNANTPYSKRVNQINLDADYRLMGLKGSQHLKFGWDSQKADRYCTGSWINCADATESTEHTLRADWRGNVTENLSARIGLASSRRTVDYDENAFLAVVPMAGRSPSTATGALAGTSAYSVLVALGLTGYGPRTGLLPAAPAGSLLAFYFPLNNALNNLLYGNENRISELIGMRRYNQADRNRDKLRSSATWQIDERFSLQGGLDLSSDHYAHSVYGLQRVTSQAINLDGTFASSENFSVSVFGSLEDQRTRSAGNTYTGNSAATAVNTATAIVGGCFATIALRNANNKIDPCLDWTATNRDQTLTLGANASIKKLMAGKLDLTGSAIYSEARTDYDITGGSYVNNPFAGIAGAATRDIAAFYVPASALPANKVKSLNLYFVGTYRIANEHSLRLAYGFQHLRSSDWGYAGLQDGGLTQVLPTREQAPNYNVHRVGISYVASF
jgi:MtrB/PioB family decaheme-associated outer membrane protein